MGCGILHLQPSGLLLLPVVGEWGAQGDAAVHEELQEVTLDSYIMSPLYALQQPHAGRDSLHVPVAHRVRCSREAEQQVVAAGQQSERRQG